MTDFNESNKINKKNIDLAVNKDEATSCNIRVKSYDECYRQVFRRSTFSKEGWGMKLRNIFLWYKPGTGRNYIYFFAIYRRL
jgi:hypothetical protein